MPTASSSHVRSTTGAPTRASPLRARSARTAARPGPPSPRAGTTGGRSTPRCTPSTWASTARQSRCANQSLSRSAPPRRAAARSQRQRAGRPPRLGRAQYVTVWSTLLYDTANRNELLRDEMEFYRRGRVDAPRPACCPPPFDVENNWMQEYPQAYVIPLGAGQRSDPEANRLVEWLLFNGAEVERLEKPYRYEGQTLEEGSYVVRMNQVRRGLIDTALGIGQDVSARISILYAPPAAWSHGYLWGADVITVPDGAHFKPQDQGAPRSRRPRRRDRRGRQRRRVRARARLPDGGPDGQRSHRRRGRGPARDRGVHDCRRRSRAGGQRDLLGRRGETTRRGRQGERRVLPPDQRRAARGRADRAGASSRGDRRARTAGSPPRPSTRTSGRSGTWASSPTRTTSRP